MSIINLGKIKFNWCGVYDPARDYHADDVVLLDGSSYVAITAIETNHAPPASGWDLMVQGITSETALLASKAELDAAINLAVDTVTKPPYLRIGSYGGWGTTSTYPGNTWNKLQCFENIVENRGGFTFDGNHTVIIPQDGIYALNCSIYTYANDFHQTAIRVNDSSILNGSNNLAYNNGYSTGYSQHLWDQQARLNAGDRIAFWFYQKSPVSSAHTVYHGHLSGSLYRLGA
ncbi:MAG: hypothetical protein AB8B77_03620 [Alphaproteobacteria bacterium]